MIDHCERPDDFGFRFDNLCLRELRFERQAARTILELPTLTEGERRYFERLRDYLDSKHARSERRELS